MQSKYKFSENLLEVNLGGEFDIEDMNSVLSEISNICLSKKIGRVLVHTRLECNNGHYSAFDQFRFGEKMSSVLSGKHVKLGIVSDCSFVDHFVETVAINRGAFIKISKNKNEINTWLDFN